jgi:hypothetical protein
VGAGLKGGERADIELACSMLIENGAQGIGASENNEEAGPMREGGVRFAFSLEADEVFGEVPGIFKMGKGESGLTVDAVVGSEGVVD